MKFICPMQERLCRRNGKRLSDILLKETVIYAKGVVAYEQ